MAEFPHCDPNVLHAPGECVYCDMHPEDQQARIQRRENFTGHGPDAATAARPLERINRWHGNVPMPPEAIAERDAYWGHQQNLLMVRYVLAYGDIEAWCDRHKGRVKGYFGQLATSGFYALAPDAPRETPWPSFFREDEIVVCDACMFADPAYQAVYGVRS